MNGMNVCRVSTHVQGLQTISQYENANLTHNDIHIALLGIFSRQTEKKIKLV